MKQSMLRYVILTGVFGLLALGAGVIVFAILVGLKEPPRTVTPARVPLVVEALRLEPQDVVVPLAGFGTARADRIAQISAEVSGRVREVARQLQDGVRVEEGDLLLQIDDRDYGAVVQRAEARRAATQSQLRQIAIEGRSLQKTLESAEAELAIAEREYARVLDLFERDTSSDRELDAVRVTLQRARRGVEELERQLAVLPERQAQLEATLSEIQAELTVAELNVQRCELRAPFAGRIERVNVELGEQVGAGTPLLTLLDPDIIEVPIELPVSWRRMVSAGTDATLQLENDAASYWNGHVARLAPSADPASRTFAAYIEVDNREHATPLVPGMFVRATVAGPHLADALIVPRNAVRRQRVFVFRDGAAYVRQVEIQQRIADDAVIVGVEPGEVVITSNLDTLSDGAPVNPQWPAVAGEPVEQGDDSGAGSAAPTAASDVPASRVP
jgi:multidrug efflux system membrane fusion protein